MTEQEAEAFTARLARVWGVKAFASGFSDSSWDWNAEIESSVIIAFHVLDTPLERTLLFFKDGRFPIFYFDSNKPQDGIRLFLYDRPQFVAQWLLFFHRGVWLSGCPIEASAHEKAEWMQGFSREEVEAWNLKM